jgi:hypothetical protein
MKTHFIFDRKQKEQQDIIAEILSLAKKKPYPNKDVTHLATFMESCFYVIEQENLAKLARKKSEIKREEWKKQELRQKEVEKQKIEALEAEAPMPQAPMYNGDGPDLLPPEGEEAPLLDVPKPSSEEPISQRSEYVLQIYGSPVGILVDKNSQGENVYNVVEPVLDRNTIQIASRLFGGELEYKNQLFDDSSYMVKVAQKVAKKTKVPFNNLLPRKLRYYLERDLLGAKSFDPLIFDEKVKAIFCEGANKSLKVDYFNLGKINTNVVIHDNQEINDLMQKIGNATSNPVSRHNPILDTTFQGLKFEGVMGLGGNKSTLTIRRVSI